MALSGRDSGGGLQLHSHPSLQSMILHDVSRTGRTIGSGSYGSVEEVAIPGAFGAAKKIHEFLTKQDPNWLAKEVADDNVKKFLSECTMMSRLRHPHIVQFLGLWFEADSNLYLVMEKMMTSLHDLLENGDPKYSSSSRPGIPLGLKCSILQDIARGLAFLHKQSPPVIHRDLSARNVLLNSAMTAKIADLGMARIMPPRDKLPMTKVPGALVYMPPEALDDSCSYNTSIDIFSLGVLIIFVLVEEFPVSLKAHSYTDEVKGLVARTELQRRENYVTKAYRELPKTHPLIWLMESCLENLPKNRPSIDRALQMLDQANAEAKGEAQLNKLQLLKMLGDARRQHEEAVRSLQKKVEIVEKENLKIHQLNFNQIGELDDYRHQTKSLMADLRAKEKEIVSLREKTSTNHDPWKGKPRHQTPSFPPVQRPTQDTSSSYDLPPPAFNFDLQPHLHPKLGHQPSYPQVSHLKQQNLQLELGTINSSQGGQFPSQYLAAGGPTIHRRGLQPNKGQGTTGEPVPVAFMAGGVAPELQPGVSSGATGKTSLTKARVLCKTAGCSFYADPKLENLCINCYEEYYEEKKELCKTAGCFFYADPKLENLCINCYEEYYEEKEKEHYELPFTKARGQGTTGEPMAFMAGGVALGLQPGVSFGTTGKTSLTKARVLCKTAGCSFYADPKLENLCINCYEEYYEEKAKE